MVVLMGLLKAEKLAAWKEFESAALSDFYVVALWVVWMETLLVVSLVD